jgi:hypothetical protein
MRIGNEPMMFSRFYGTHRTNRYSSVVDPVDRLLRDIIWSRIQPRFDKLSFYTKLPSRKQLNQIDEL